MVSCATFLDSRKCSSGVSFSSSTSPDPDAIEPLAGPRLPKINRPPASLRPSIAHLASRDCRSSADGGCVGHPCCSLTPALTSSVGRHLCIASRPLRCCYRQVCRSLGPLPGPRQDPRPTLWKPAPSRASRQRVRCGGASGSAWRLPQPAAQPATHQVSTGPAVLQGCQTAADASPPQPDRHCVPCGIPLSAAGPALRRRGKRRIYARSLSRCSPRLEAPPPKWKRVARQHGWVWVGTLRSLPRLRWRMGGKHRRQPSTGRGCSYF